MSIETASSSSKAVLNENQLLSLLDEHSIQLKSPETFTKLIQTTAKIHRGLSIFAVEHLQTTWIESMKELSTGDLSNQWLFRTNDNSEENDDSATENTQSFQQLWTHMDIFKDDQVSAFRRERCAEQGAMFHFSAIPLSIRVKFTRQRTRLLLV